MITISDIQSLRFYCNGSINTKFSQELLILLKHYQWGKIWWLIASVLDALALVSKMAPRGGPLMSQIFMSQILSYFILTLLGYFQLLFRLDSIATRIIGNQLKTHKNRVPKEPKVEISRAINFKAKNSEPNHAKMKTGV